MIDAYGKEKFLQAFKELQNSDNRQVQEQNTVKLTSIYGKSLKEIQKQWQDAFMESQ